MTMIKTRTNLTWHEMLCLGISDSGMDDSEDLALNLKKKNWRLNTEGR